MKTTLILAALLLGLAGYSQTNSVTVGKGKKYHADTGTNRTFCGRIIGSITTNAVNCKLCLRKLVKIAAPGKTNTVTIVKPH